MGDEILNLSKHFQNAKSFKNNDLEVAVSARWGT